MTVHQLKPTSNIKRKIIYYLPILHLIRSPFKDFNPILFNNINDILWSWNLFFSRILFYHGRANQYSMQHLIQY